MNVGPRILALSAALALAAVSVSGQSVTRLTLGQTIDAELKGGGVNVYDVELTAGTFFSATFDQRGADVHPVINGPDGKVLYDYDGSEYGWEPALVIAPVTGVYRLEARSARASAAAGRYQLHVDAMRPPTAEDEARVHIAALQSQALVAFKEHKRDSTARAHDVMAQALDEWKALGDPRGEAHATRVMAMIANNLDDFPSQIEYRRKEIALRDRLGDDYGEAEALSGLAQGLGILGDTDQAREALTRSLALHQAAGRLAPASEVLQQLSHNSRTSGEFSEALDEAYQALALARQAGDRRREGQSLFAIGATHFSLGEYDATIETYKRGAALNPEPNAQAEAWLFIGATQIRLGDYEAAVPNLEQSLAVWTTRGWRGSQSNVLRTLGDLYMTRGSTGSARVADLERARDLFEQAAARATEASFASGEALARRRLAEVLLELGRLDEAERALAQATEVVERNSDPIARAAILADQASLAVTRGQLDAAHRQAADAVASVESVRGRAENSRVLAAMMASNQRVYEAYVRVLMAEHEANPSAGFDRQALEISERARARSLLEMVMNMRPDAVGAESSAIDELRRLQERIHSKAQAADAAQRAKRANAAALTRELSELTDQFGLAEARLKRETPGAATVASPDPLTVDAIQHEVLDPDTVLVEYMLAEPESYAWVVSQGSLSAHRLTSRSTIEAAAEKCRGAVALPPSSSGKARAQAAGSASASAALSRLLLDPLGPLPAGKRLLIVAPGSLQQVAFAGLTDGSGVLVARHEIVHAPSASIVAAVRRLDDRRPEAARALAVFADPVFDASDPRVTGHWATSSAGDAREPGPTPLARAVRSVAPDATTLPRLPFTRHEADTIAALAPRDSTLKATDFAANLRQVTKPSLADYRILHFATHGLLDTHTPELSGLVFSLVTENGRPQDGFLRLTDISRLRLNADLAVLSGCDTGRGRSIDGEGVIGLTRSFVIAGARRVVASLWEVDDLATAELMRRFYREMLERHRPPSAALAIAQRQMAASERWGAPYFWAGFVIQGEWREATATKGN